MAVLAKLKGTFMSVLFVFIARDWISGSRKQYFTWIKVFEMLLPSFTGSF